MYVEECMYPDKTINNSVRQNHLSTNHVEGLGYEMSISDVAKVFKADEEVIRSNCAYFGGVTICENHTFYQAGVMNAYMRINAEQNTANTSAFTPWTVCAPSVTHPEQKINPFIDLKDLIESHSTFKSERQISHSRATTYQVSLQ